MFCAKGFLKEVRAVGQNFLKSVLLAFAVQPLVGSAAESLETC